MNMAKTRVWLFRLLLVVLAPGSLIACGSDDNEPAEPEHAEGEGPSGTPEGVVLLDTAALSIAGIQVDAVQTVETSALPVTGTITYDQNRVSHIGPKTEGRIAALRADLGTRVRPGQTLALLESADIGSLRADLTEAEALLAIARENYERERRLEEQGISSRKELLDARADLRRAEAAARSSRERLRILGAAGGSGGQFAVIAPFGGTVVEKHAGLGEVVGPEDQLFTVADLGGLWIELDIFERDLSRVAVGQPVDVTTTAYPGRIFPGRIVYVGDVLDPERRTVRARVEVPNPDRALKPGMFASARIRTGAPGPARIVVPEGAVQELEGRQVVFVPGQRPGEFRSVPVEVGEVSGEDRTVVILSGLSAGDRVVVEGAFSLRSELAKGEIGEHGH